MKKPGKKEMELITLCVPFHRECFYVTGTQNLLNAKVKPKDEPREAKD